MERTRFDSWLAAAVGAGVILTSWIFIPIPTLGFDLPKLLPLALASFVASVLLLFGDRVGFLPSVLRVWPGQLALLFFAVAFLSLLWSVAPLLSFVGSPARYEGVLTYAAYAAIFLGSIAAMQSVRGRLILFPSLLVANIGVVLYGLLQILRIDPLASFWVGELFLGRTFSTLGQPNVLGVFLILTIPFVLQIAKRSHERWHQIALGLLLISNVLLLLGTVSRSAIFGLAAAVLLGFLWKRPRFKAMTARQWIAVMILAALLALTAGFFLRKRFETPTEAGRSTSVRLIMAEAGQKMLKARPIGFGLETTGILSGRYLGPEILRYESLTTRIDRLHSQPLDLLVTLGPLGLIAFYAFLVLLLMELWKHRRTSQNALPCAMALLGSSVALLGGFHLMATAAVFWAVAGMAVGSTVEHGGSSLTLGATIWFQRALPLFLAILTLLLTIVAVYWTKARVDMERGEQWLNAGNFEEAVRSYAAASERFPFDRELLLQAAETNLLALEQTEDQATVETLHTFTTTQLNRLDRLTGEQDGMGMLLRAWHKALQSDRGAVDWYIMQAALAKPDGVSTYRIAAHAYELLGDGQKVREAKENLKRILPAGWDDPESERGRILQKEHPWLTGLMEY